AGSDQPSVRALASLHAEAPKEKRTPLEAATVWLSIPRNAWVALAASILLLILGPMGVAWGRYKLAAARAEKIHDLRVGSEGLEKKAAMYAQLEISRWPMTKLLGDISSATPEKIVVTNLQLTTNQGLVLNGTAESPEDISKLESNLNATRLFTN